MLVNGSDKLTVREIVATLCDRLNIDKMEAESAANRIKDGACVVMDTRTPTIITLDKVTELLSQSWEVDS